MSLGLANRGVQTVRVWRVVAPLQEKNIMTSKERFIAQSVTAETNLIRLALEAEKYTAKSIQIHDIVNDCLVSAALLRDARKEFQSPS